MKKGLIGGLLLTCLVLPAVWGQAWGAYPSKPIDFILGVVPGGGVDVLARMISAYLLKTERIQVNVINKPGGSSLPAELEVMTARPDGYTLQIAVHGIPLRAAFLGKLPFDWRKRTWICRLTQDTLVYEVRMDAPWRSLKDVAEHIRKNPGKLSWGSSGVAGVALPGMIQFLRANNISIDKTKFVMFPGEAASLTALAGSHIDFAAQQVGPSWSLIEGKKIRPLAVVAEKRFPGLSEVPTAAEAGYPTLDTRGWHGVCGPPGIPKEVVDWWTTKMQKATKDPMFLEMADNAKKQVIYLGPKEFEAFVETEYSKFADMARDKGLLGIK